MLPLTRLRHLLTRLFTLANEQDRVQVGELAQALQEVTGSPVEVASVGQGSTGYAAAEAAKAHGRRLEVVKRTFTKRGFVLLPSLWVVERSFAWTTRFRRLVRDDERLPATRAFLHLVAFACLVLHQGMAFSNP